jgi:hypothetical protein
MRSQTFRSTYKNKKKAAPASVNVANGAGTVNNSTSAKVAAKVM